MKTSQKSFGSYQGQAVRVYYLENDQGTRIGVLNFAGIWQEFSVMIKGQRHQLLLQSDDISGYTDNDLYLNRVIARTAGRINHARFSLKGKMVQTSPNENSHSLHGGDNSFAHQFFQVTVHPEKGQIVLNKSLTEEEDTFPGNLALTVTYTLTESNKVTISFSGSQTVTDGVFNPTMHAYFNLAENQIHTVKNHDLWIDSGQHLEMDAEKIPTGRLLKNDDAFDLFEQPHLGPALDKLDKQSSEKGFDDVFAINENHQGAIARLRDNDSNFEIALYSTRNALVVYTANSLTHDVGLNHGGGQAWIAVALEAQTLPNSENMPEFGDVTLAKDSHRKESISYQFLKS